jgi:hypothetical protein
LKKKIAINISQLTFLPPDRKTTSNAAYLDIHISLCGIGVTLFTETNVGPATKTSTTLAFITPESIRTNIVEDKATQTICNVALLTACTITTGRTSKQTINQLISNRVSTRSLGPVNMKTFLLRDTFDAGNCFSY